MPGDTEHPLYDASDWRFLWDNANRHPLQKAAFLKLADEMDRYEKSVWHNGRNPHVPPVEMPRVVDRVSAIVNGDVQQFSRELAFTRAQCDAEGRMRVAEFSRSQQPLDEIGPVEFSTWNPDEHPRGQPENAGEFAEKGASRQQPPEKVFSSWFSGSKIVDGSGRPLMVYTGQRRRLESAPDSVDRNELPFGVMFLTDDRDAASKYAGSHPDERPVYERQSLRDYVGGYDISDEHIAEAERRTGKAWDEISLDEAEESLKDVVNPHSLLVQKTRDPKTRYSLGRRGKTYKCYLSIKNPFNLDEFNESDWRKAFLHSSGEEIPNSRESRDEIIAGEIGLTRGQPWDTQDDEEQVGWYDRRSDYYSTDLDLEEFIKRRWEEEKVGTYLMGALNESPSGMASVMFPEAAEWLVNKRGYDGAFHTDTEVGGTTYIPFRPNQIKLAKNTVFDADDDRISFSMGHQI